jgi:hypothetical protein
LKKIKLLKVASIFLFSRMKILGIDGQAGMKLIFGTTVAGEKGKVGKEDKVIFCFCFCFFFLKKKKKSFRVFGTACS